MTEKQKKPYEKVCLLSFCILIFQQVDLFSWCYIFFWHYLGKLQIAKENKEKYTEEMEAYKQKKEEEAVNLKKEDEEQMKIQKQEALQLLKKKEKAENIIKVITLHW